MSDEGTKKKVLAVHEDPTVLAAITSLLKADGTLDVHKARNAAEGRLLAGEVKPDLIIFNCQASMDCTSFFREIKADLQPSPPVFLLLSDRADAEDLAKAIEKGVDDYIEKSLCSHVLLAKVRSLLHAKGLGDALRHKEKTLKDAFELLERNFKELTSILLKILEVRIPGASDRASVAKAAAEFLAERLHIEEEKRKNLVFGALLHEIGKVGLPDDIVGKRYNRLPAASIPTFQQYTTVGSMVISTMTGFKGAADAVYHQLENFDGTGFPGGLMGEQIPIDARILRAIVFQEELRAEGCPVEEMIDRIRVAMHTILDQKVANPLIEYLLEQNRRPDTNRLKVPLDELKAGMVIADDVYASSGVKLLPKGIRLHEKILSILMDRNREDPIIGGVYIVTE
jgi:response regulator RpfG family c-di-GMP phosphodiesterase